MDCQIEQIANAEKSSKPWFKHFFVLWKSQGMNIPWRYNLMFNI